MDLGALAMELPKAELHVHIEGTLEPELMFALARRNDLALPYSHVEDVRSAYRFENLQSFLDIYYRSCGVLRTEADFFDLTWAYLERAATQGVRHSEIFVDPQTHAANGVTLKTVLRGIGRALEEGQGEFSVSSHIIVCFLRDQPEQAARATLEEVLTFGDVVIGVGLDSAEIGHPPRDFEAVFGMARSEGLQAVAHAGEEGPAAYIWEALDLLGAMRIDHGVRCLEDEALVRRLGDEQIPLTVCPLSNVRLRVVDRLSAHPLPVLLERGLLASVHSDDPSYFGGYIGDNYAAIATHLGLDGRALAQIAANSFTASFLEDGVKQRHLQAIEATMRAWSSA
jgi:adenosine deaminase